MVTFNNAGRFGNWFFEAATCIAYAMKHDLNFTVPNGSGKDPYWNPVYCRHLIDDGFDPNKESVHLWENGHQYKELPFQEEWRGKNIVIEGYRQSEKYFKDFRNEILYLLDFKWVPKPYVVSIHIRRGDYLHLTQKHILYDIKYMLSAMRLFLEKGYSNFKVFSDDIPWCMQEFARPEYSGINIEFSTNKDEVSDVEEISGCEHHINSSSTFAWAGAWLNRNPNKIVVTPELWFQPGWGGLETKDIIPETWIKL